MYLRLFFFYCLIYGQPLLGQNCLDLIHNKPLYSSANEIVNGRKWIKDDGYIGSPMLEENYWPRADILYNGIQYKGIPMNYDLFREALIVFYPEKGRERYVVIKQDYLSGFSYIDTLTGRTRFYKYIELPGISSKTLYESIPLNKISFYIKPGMNIQATPSEQTKGKFIGYSRYYLDTGHGYTTFRTRGQLMKLLANHKPEMNKFIRKQKLKINYKYPEDIITAIKYFDGLN
jgi:hypothetical protein